MKPPSIRQFSTIFGAQVRQLWVSGVASPLIWLESLQLGRTALEPDRTEEESDREAFILFFNENCSKCASLASHVRRYSKGKIETASLLSDRAAEVLLSREGLGITFNIHLVFAGTDSTGLAAVFRLARLVGFYGGLKLLILYVYYELRMNKASHMN